MKNPTKCHFCDRDMEVGTFINICNKCGLRTWRSKNYEMYNMIHRDHPLESGPINCYSFYLNINNCNYKILCDGEQVYLYEQKKDICIPKY